MKVVIGSLSGNCNVVVDIFEDTTVGELKEKSAELWKFPAVFQRLVIREDVPADTEVVAKYFKADEPELRVTLILTLACLEDPDDEIRGEALMALDSLIQQEDDNIITHRAICALGACLEDPAASMRALALKVLGDLAQPGDESLVEACLARLQDAEPMVVSAALGVISKGVPRGNKRVIEAVRDCLANANATHGEDVTFAAVRTLGSVAERGDATAVSALVGSLTDPNGYVRLLVLDVLSVTAPLDEPATFAAVRECLKDRESNMRKKSVDVLCSSASKGDETTIEAILTLLEDPIASVRTAALAGLGRLAPPGHAGVLDRICACAAESGDTDVKCVGLEVLAKLVAGAGHPRTEEVARFFLQDEDPDVQECAQDLLKEITG